MGAIIFVNFKAISNANDETIPENDGYIHSEHLLIHYVGFQMLQF